MKVLDRPTMERLFAVTDDLGLDREAITVPLAMEGPGAVRRLPNGRFEIALPEEGLEEFLAMLPDRLVAAGWEPGP
jgi:hypothetical protein